MYRYIFRFAVMTLTILTVNLITNAITNYMVSYKSHYKPVTFTSYWNGNTCGDILSSFY